MTTDEMFVMMRESAVAIATREASQVRAMIECGHPATPPLSRETVLMLATVLSVEAELAMDGVLRAMVSRRDALGDTEEVLRFAHRLADQGEPWEDAIAQARHNFRPATKPRTFEGE